MQRIGTNRCRRIIFHYIFPVVLAIFLVAFDQVFKLLFESLHGARGDIIVIRGFFTLTCVKNTGAAWSFLSGASWGQIFLKVLTVLALCGFIAVYVMAVRKSKKWLIYSLVFIIGGTIGNFIDRLFLGGVIDFLSFNIFGYDFPVFNFADCFLVVGTIMILIQFFFLDDDAIFKKSKKKLEKKDDEGENAD